MIIIFSIIGLASVIAIYVFRRIKTKKNQNLIYPQQQSISKFSDKIGASHKHKIGNKNEQDLKLDSSSF